MHRCLPRAHLVPGVILLLAFFAAMSLQSPAGAAPLTQKETPHPVQGREDCLLCHKIGGPVKPVPANHANYNNATCLACHKVAAGSAQPTQAPAQPTAAPARSPAAPAQPTQPPQAPAGPKGTPHDLVGKQDCLLCHKVGGPSKPVPANHSAYTNQTCLGCHPVVAAQPTAAPAQPTATRPPAAPGAPSLIPHVLEGRAACSTCHGVAGAKPYPQNHVGRPDSGCLQCHVVATSPRAPTPGTGATLPTGADTCLSCHKQPTLSMSLSSGQQLSLFIDGELYKQSTHGAKGLECVSCHPTAKTYPHPAVDVATARELNRGIIQEACATCHKTIYDEYKDSVHGKDLLEAKNLDVPSCTDCHGIHNIRDPKTALFRVNSPDLCSTCHANAQLMGKYGISPNVTRTYLNDFHGATVRLSRDKDPNIWSYKAVCYDCHGIHNIKQVKDPNSQVLQENLVKTCQKCHTGADVKFPAAWTSHYEPSLEKWPLVYLVNLFYSILIPVTVIGMLGFIGLDIAHRVAKKRKSGKTT